MFARVDKREGLVGGRRRRRTGGKGGGRASTILYDAHTAGIIVIYSLLFHAEVVHQG